MRRVKKSAASYSAHVAELRKYATGFAAAEGFDRRKPNEWTAVQKRQITRYAKALQALTARPNVVFRARNEDNLRRVQRDAGQHPEGLPRFKVAFIPFTQRPGAPRPTITITKNVVSIGGEHWDKKPLPFDMRALVHDPQAEIRRVVKLAPGAKSYTVQAGEFEIIGEGHRDVKSITNAVIKLMLQYDGVKDLPRGSGNRGDASKHHHFSKWLHGINAYNFHGKAQPRQLLKAMADAKEKRRLEKDAQRSRIKRALRRAFDAGCRNDTAALQAILGEGLADSGRIRHAWEEGRRECARIDRLRGR